jgi:hypothetical protein
MRHPDDPARLVEDPNAPAPLVEALRAARGPAPDPARLASLGLALGLPVPAAIAPPAPLAPAPAAPLASPAAAVAGVGAAKVALTGIAAVGVAAAVAVGGFGVGRGKAPPPPRPIPAVVEKFEARAPEPLEEAALPIDEPAAPAPAAAPASRRRHHVRPAPAPVAAAPPAEAPADVASRLREEAALVQRAERLLDADPAGALRLVDERRRRFPTGALDQEAEVVAIDALLRLGRRADAASRARTFEAAHAGSLHARRIKRLMGQ